MNVDCSSHCQFDEKQKKNDQRSYANAKNNNKIISFQLLVCAVARRNFIAKKQSSDNMINIKYLVVFLV